MHPIPDGDLLQIHTNKNSLVIRLNLHHEGILSRSRGRNIFLGGGIYITNNIYYRLQLVGQFSNISLRF